MKTKTEIEKKLIWIFMSLVLVLAIFYGYFVKNIVAEALKAEEAKAFQAFIYSEIGSLEVKYISLKNQVDMEKAIFMGYQETRQVKFISQNILGGLTFKE